jgi:hypothetical protein
MTPSLNNRRRRMSPVKAIAVLFFVVSIGLGGLELMNAYDA